MNDTLDRNPVTTTAATQQTEPEVVAAIASGDGHMSNIRDGHLEASGGTLLSDPDMSPWEIRSWS